MTGRGGLVGAGVGGWYGQRLGLSYLVNLTPAARSSEVINHGALNLAEVLNRAEKDPDKMVKYIKSVGNTPHDLAAELSMRSLDAPNAAVLPMALKDYGATADNMLVGWHATEWSRQMLDNIAGVLGKDPAEVLGELSKTDTDAATLLRRYVDAARQSGDEAAQAIENAMSA